MGGREYGQTPRDAAIEQFPGDHARLDGLADAHVVGDQESHRIEAQSHDQRHELVGTRRNRNAAEGTERGCTGAKTEAGGVEQGHHAGRVTGLCRRRWHKFGGDDLSAFERQIDANLVGLPPRQWAQAQDARLLAGQNYPIAPTCADKGTGRKATVHHCSHQG